MTNLANKNNDPQQQQTPPPAHHSNRGEFLKCLSEFFKRDLLAIPVVKKFPHVQLSQRCGLKAITLELDTAAYPNIEYIAGTRLSVYPLNPVGHVSAIMEHLVDDLQQHQVMVNNWNKFLKLNGKETLRLALTYLFDIMTAPSRELLRLLADACREKDQRKKLVAISQTNESWERWLCSGHRTLRSLLDELSSCKINASVLLNELNLQQPRQYSISNIKSAKRFRAEIVVVQHRFSLRQIELNLRQLRDHEIYERTISPTGSPPAPSRMESSLGGGTGNVATAHAQQPTPPTQPQQHPPPQGSKSNSRSASAGGPPRSPMGRGPGSSSSAAAMKSSTGGVPTSAGGPVKSATSLPKPVARRPPGTPPTLPAPAVGRSPSRPPQGMAAVSSAAAHRANSSKGSQASNRSVRSMASFASSPISTHQVRRVSSFSGPLMSAYANATASQISSLSMVGSSSTGALAERSSSARGAAAKSSAGRKSMLSVLESQNRTINSETGALAAAQATSAGGLSPGQATTTTTTGASQTTTKYEGLCSNYLLNLGSNDHLLCEFVENPRFTLKGNRERPIMMIGQDVGMIAFRAFWQQRHLEHDRAQVFYSLFKDLSPKKFGDMQLVCLSGHKGRVEELFKREIQQAVASKILSSYTCVNRKHLLAVLAAATNKSQLVLSQMQQNQQQQLQSQQGGPNAFKSTLQQPGGLGQVQNLPINSRELLELGDRIYKLLVENNGCLYTCCDPHMTQAIEILAFESIARNNPALTREKLMKLLPKWKGRTAADERAEDTPAFFTLENTYERAAIVQEIYDSSI